MATEPETRHQRRPATEVILSQETDRLPAFLLRTTPFSEPEPPKKWPLIVLGAAALFAVVLGGGYWLIKPGQTPIAAVVVPPPNAGTTAAKAPTSRPPPLPVSGMPRSNGQPNESAPVAMKSSVPAPTSQSSTLVVGLRPITSQRPPGVPAPEAEVPLPSFLFAK